jgi:hypothetical protein
MDETFSLVATHMPRRRMTPFATKMTVMLSVLGLLVLLFGAFVMGQQHAADARRAALLVERRAEAAAQAQALATEDGATDPSVSPSGADVADLLDDQARSAAETALHAAVGIASGGSVELASPAGMTQAEHTLLYVDGPSTAPSVISIYAGTAGWAAAVRGGDHQCFWVALTPDGRERYGTGSPCTGTAALGADRPTW